MDHKIAHKEHPLPLTYAPLSQVTTYLICRNTLLRTAIGHLLSDTQFVLAQEAVNEPSDLPAITGPGPALVLLCESLDLNTCVAALAKLRITCPSARLVVMTDDLATQDVVQLCQAGLGGICPTTMQRSTLVKALEVVMLGETFLPGSVSFELLKQRLARPLHGSSPNPASATTGETGKLTARETQNLRCLIKGASNKIIARELGLSEATVKVHLKAILRKVSAENRTQAAMWAQEHMALAPYLDVAAA